MQPPIDPPRISRDRYCSPNVSLETAWAIYIELERFEGQRWGFMFWKGGSRLDGLKSGKPQIRDHCPDDFNSWTPVPNLTHVEYAFAYVGSSTEAGRFGLSDTLRCCCIDYNRGKIVYSAS